MEKVRPMTQAEAEGWPVGPHFVGSAAWTFRTRQSPFLKGKLRIAERVIEETTAVETVHGMDTERPNTSEDLAE